jgi:uncharacterized cupin superfamily protein
LSELDGRRVNNRWEERMVEEARIEKTEDGDIVVSDGWFVMHVSEVPWMRSERFGKGCRFEGRTRFPQVAINLRVLEPGKPACLYHRENAQEDFLVLAGECILLVEEQERRVRAGDFVHCPPNATHVFVGAPDQQAVVLMIGYRPETEEICYPVSEVAAAYGASVEVETTDVAEAYGPRKIVPIASQWPLPGFEGGQPRPDLEGPDG